MSCHKLADADLRADRYFERANLRTSTVYWIELLLYIEKNIEDYWKRIRGEGNWSILIIKKGNIVSGINNLKNKNQRKSTVNKGNQQKTYLKNKILIILRP